MINRGPLLSNIMQNSRVITYYNLRRLHSFYSPITRYYLACDVARDHNVDITTESFDRTVSRLRSDAILDILLAESEGRNMP